MWESRHRRRFSIGKHGHGVMVSRANVMSPVTHTHSRMCDPLEDLVAGCLEAPLLARLWKSEVSPLLVGQIGHKVFLFNPSRCEEDCCVLFSLRKVTPLDPGGHWRRHYQRTTQWIPPSIIFIMRFAPFSFLRLSSFWNTSCVEVLGSIFQWHWWN